MYDHYLVAKSADYDKENILLLDNGEVIVFENGILKDEHLEVPVGDILIDGSNVGVVDTDVIKERSQLAEEGVIFIYCALDMRLRKVSNEISIKTKGFTHAFTDDELTTIISGLAEKIINNSFKKKSWNLESVKDSVAEEVRKLIVRFTKHRPIIVPVFIEI
jgi:ribonuclease J